MSTQAAYNKLLEGRGKKEPTTHLEVVKFWLQRSGCKWCYNDKGYYWFKQGNPRLGTLHIPNRVVITFQVVRGHTL